MLLLQLFLFDYSFYLFLRVRVSTRNQLLLKRILPAEAISSVFIYFNVALRFPSTPRVVSTLTFNLCLCVFFFLIFCICFFYYVFNLIYLFPSTYQTRSSILIHSLSPNLTTHLNYFTFFPHHTRIYSMMCHSSFTNKHSLHNYL